MDDPTTYEDRQGASRDLCEQVAVAVRIISPKGLGHWARIGEFVDAPNAEFLLALTRCETDTTDDAGQDMNNAYSALCNAWRYASAAYLVGMAPDEQSTETQTPALEPFSFSVDGTEFDVPGAVEQKFDDGEGGTEEWITMPKSAWLESVQPHLVDESNREVT